MEESSDGLGEEAKEKIAMEEEHRRTIYAPRLMKCASLDGPFVWMFPPIPARIVFFGGFLGRFSVTCFIRTGP